MKLTTQDRIILDALCSAGRWESSYMVARRAGITTSSRSETAARHLIKMAKSGLVERRLDRGTPIWIITDAGREALKAQSDIRT